MTYVGNDFAEYYVGDDRCDAYLGWQRIDQGKVRQFLRNSEDAVDFGTGNMNWATDAWEVNLEFKSVTSVGTSGNQYLFGANVNTYGILLTSNGLQLRLGGTTGGVTMANWIVGDLGDSQWHMLNAKWNGVDTINMVLDDQSLPPNTLTGAINVLSGKRFGNRNSGTNGIAGDMSSCWLKVNAAQDSLFKMAEASGAVAVNEWGTDGTYAGTATGPVAADRFR